MKPDQINPEGRYDAFDNGKVLYGKKKGQLPAMGWNSWNAFGSGNTEALTREMADRMVELGLDGLGYRYVVLDDGCYKPERVAGRLSNDEEKFPGGFRALSDYIHAKGLKFGMYNDIGTNLCAGAEVGTYLHEEEDADSYIGWGVDFLKVDNCYYMWDNATFSCPANARYSFAPNIRAIRVGDQCIPVTEGRLTGSRASMTQGQYVTGIGTYDGTGPEASPVGLRSSELIFEVEAAEDRQETVSVEYATGREEGTGAWLQLAVGEEICFDDLLEETETAERFAWSDPMVIRLKKGRNTLRIMNHRRQENTLHSYARLFQALGKIRPDHDILLSACEWGKTHPQNWAYKVCGSWRILNDITFKVGRDGDPGHCGWTDDYTCSVTTQYNKCVIMDTFAGLDRGWNDPDMMVIGMDGLNITQNRTHMVMWCMMNAPLMLGMDLRRISRGDALYEIIADRELIALNQDSLGIPAKRVFCSLCEKDPDQEYIRDIHRVDILAKPLSGDRFALSFINVSEEDRWERYAIDVSDLKRYFGDRICRSDCYTVRDLQSGQITENTTGTFAVDGIDACDNITLLITPKNPQR